MLQQIVGMDIISWGPWTFVYITHLLLLRTAGQLDSWYKWGSKCLRFGAHDDLYDYVKTDCVSNHGGQLMIIEDAYKMEFIRNILTYGVVSVTGYYFVVGMSLNRTINAFRWSDGTAPLPEFWASGYPKYKADRSEAVLVYYIHKNSWYLIDQTKDVYMHFACEKPATLITQGNVKPDIRSYNGRERAISAMDIANLCVLFKVIVRSKTACSRSCISTDCNIFGYERSTSMCVIYITREQDVCETLSSTNTYKYYKMDYGIRYTCETMNLIKNTPTISASFS